MPDETELADTTQLSALSTTELSTFSHDVLPTEESAVDPEERTDLQALQLLRRLIHAADIFSRQLIRQHQITGPQLACLHKLLEHDGLTVSDLSKAIYLSPSTVVGILDRLERQGLVTRIRSTHDRRKVLLHVTHAGRDLVGDAPSPLLQALQQGLEALPTPERSGLLRHLEQLVDMLEPQHIEAGSFLSPEKPAQAS